MTQRDAAFDPDPLAAALLDPQAPAAAQDAACAAFHALCLARLPALGERATALASGHALAPADAARCVLDHLRTARLVRALDARIAARAAQGTEVRVLYAGCGPLAPLALLLARRWRGRGVSFDLLDVHAQSIEAARHLFDCAGVSSVLGRVCCADAATLRLDDGEAPHVLVAEVMQRALMREPQIAVVANLLPQCAPDAALVPETITVDAVCGDPAQSCGSSPPNAGREDAEPAPHDAALASSPTGRLLELSPRTVPVLAEAIRRGAQALPEIALRIPQDLPCDAPGLLLATRIEAGPGEVLQGNDSGLTMPLFVAQLGRVAAGETLGFTYRLAGDPGFAVRRIETATQ